ncbi:MAG: hypothetical protein ACXAD7_03885 [Candidatus Kariarchaeaceae archaeon]|jgi:hypothetical protein
MMDYEFSFYKEEYLDRHYEIGNFHLSKWLGAQQSEIETLKKAYSKEGFDKETKFYALHNGKVIGFITSSIQVLDDNTTASFMEFPLIEDPHQQVAEELIDFAYKSLRKKGVTKVISRASPYWGNTIDFFKKYGYEFSEVLWKSARLNVSEFKHYMQNSQSRAVVDQDFADILKIHVKFRKLTKEEAQKQINLLSNIPERVISWRIVEEDDRIIGYDHLVQDKFISDKARMNAIFAESDQVRDQIISDHVKAAEEKKIKYIDNFFWGPTIDLDKDYEKYGFFVTDVSSYIQRPLIS